MTHMWFKNLTLYRFYKPFDITTEEMEKKLQSIKFRNCGKLEMFSYGLTSPLGKKHTTLTHTLNGYILICGKKEEKILPASVIKDLIEEKSTIIEDTQLRKVGRKEKEDIRDEVLQDLLPKALTKMSNTYAYFDIKNGWLIVDSASQNKAEELTSALRIALGSLPIEPPKTHTPIPVILTNWMINKNLPDDLKIGEECELRGNDISAGIVRCKNHDLSLNEIKNHLSAGKQCTQLMVIWEERISFLLCDDFSIKRLKFGEIIINESNDQQTETAEEQLDADFSLMTLELSRMLTRLQSAMSG